MAIQVFGQGAVQSVYPSYLSLNIKNPNQNFPAQVGDVTLVWSTSYVNVPYRDPITNIYYQVLAATMDVTAGNEDDHTVTLPDATKTSKGQTFIIGNTGDSDFSLNHSDGELLQVVGHGISYWITLIDNSTSAGVWRVITLGAGTSEASAAALAGKGLIAIVDKLNTNITTVIKNASFTVDETNRAQFVIWTGGSGMTMSLPEITDEDFPDGFYVSITNQGSGVLTIQPTDPQTISGLTNLSIQSQQSLTIISDGTNWQTLGFGQNQLAVDTINNLNVNSIVGTRDLSSVESSSIIQNYTGTLTGNITIYFPVQVNNWFINNDTTVNGFNITVRLKNNGTPVGNSYVLPRGSSEIFFSDGASLFRSPTALSLINGTEGFPALSFSTDNSTGIYKTTAGSIGMSVAGNLIGEFTNVQFLAPLYTTAASPAYSFLGGVNTGMYYEEQRLSFSFQGVDVAAFTSEAGDAGSLVIISPTTNKNLSLSSFETHGDVTYNNVTSISISTTGIVTLPAAPLPVASGGTNAVTSEDALNNLMPVAAMGDIVFFNGTDWVVLPIGNPGDVLTVNGAGNGLEWVAP